MIAWLKGRCHSIESGQVVIDVRDVGYRVWLSAPDAESLQVGDETDLHIHTVVREESFTLYGFRSLAGLEMFRTILTISGVGPKGALALLSSLSPGQIARAIHDDQPRALTVAKGIGKRTAELIVVRLRERLPAELLTGAIEDSGAVVSEWSKAMRDAKSALVNLGFRPAAAEKAVREVAVDSSDDFEQLLRLALSAMRRPHV